MNKRQVLQTLAEIVLIFAVFFVEGACRVPDSDEPHYLGKAIHYWNPDWVSHDFFLDSQNPHRVFYFALGWLSLVLSPLALAWVGRVVAWGLVAWGWQRLNVAVLPRPWWSVLTAAMLVTLNLHYNLAGEWAIGGVEAVEFGYTFVFLGLAKLVRGRWNSAFLLFGVAAMFHILIGGWAAMAGGVAWLLMPKDRPPVRALWPGILGGALIALPNLLPAIALTWGVAPDIVRRAESIYVFERLHHHLVPTLYITRFLVLVALWLTVCWLAPPDRPLRRLQAFVTGALGFVAVGGVLGVLGLFEPEAAARLLRFYWFRLADVMVPVGIALAASCCLAWELRARPLWGRAWLAFAIIIFGIHEKNFALDRYYRVIPRADRMTKYREWREVCQWIAEPKNIPPGVRFLTPPMYQSFKWYTGHSEVVTWKDIPQDARSIVEWWARLKDLHAAEEGQPLAKWHEWLTKSDPEQLRQLGQKYQADYLLTAANPQLNLPVVYKNPAYAVYRLSPSKMP